LRGGVELLPEERAHGDVGHGEHLGEARGVGVLLRARAAHDDPLHAPGAPAGGVKAGGRRRGARLLLAVLLPVGPPLLHRGRRRRREPPVWGEGAPGEGGSGCGEPQEGGHSLLAAARVCGGFGGGRGGRWVGAGRGNFYVQQGAGKVEGGGEVALLSLCSVVWAGVSCARPFGARVGYERTRGTEKRPLAGPGQAGGQVNCLAV
jgi:hypothetical protein